MSVSEIVIWAHLKNDQLGFRFHPQFPVLNYILDFYCAEAKVCVEMDSDLHDEAKDKVRDEALKKEGILTIRIPNIDILGLKENPSRDWLKHIQDVCKERTGQLEYPSID